MMSDQDKQDKPSYKKTLNPRQTSFAMKANLVQREPEFQKRWDRIGVYQQLRERAAGKPRYILHDGPLYANGSIHLGHLLNKVLKDMVVRSHNMLGYDAPFIPGWDCHGLPPRRHGRDTRCRSRGRQGALRGRPGIPAERPRSRDSGSE